MRCPNCGTELADSMLVCPACQTLTYQERLRELAGQAQQAADAGDRSAALGFWRDALALLPNETRQAKQIVARIEGLTHQSQDHGEPAIKRWATYGAGLGAVALLVWKFKAVVIFLLTKAKLLLLGLTKTSTLFSMLLSLGVYWTVFGWPFALGLVLSIYIHEMGHVFALNRLGIRASAPMFIPGLGAMVRMDQYPATPAEDARVGLAGPVWGMFAAIGAWLVYLAGAGEIWGAIARVGAWLNLFNLIPFWQLDGHRGFRAMSRTTRLAMLMIVAGAAWLSQEGMLWLIVIAGLFTLRGSPPENSDASATLTYTVLIVVLSFLTTLQLPGLAG